MDLPAAHPDPHKQRGRLIAWAAPVVGRWFVVPVLIMTLVGLAYRPVLHNGFIWDDDDYVQNNSTLDDVAGLRRIWLEPGATPQYYPLVFTSFWVENHLWGRHPLGYHVVNVLLHALSAVLLWRLLERLRVPGAGLAALIFAVHPVMVESVAWITERKNTLSLAWYLVSATAYLNYLAARGRGLDADRFAARRGAAWWYAAGLVGYSLALTSKTVTATLPAALLVVTWWKRGRLAWCDARPLLPWFAVGVPVGLFTVWMEKTHVGADGPAWNLSVLERLALAGRVAWFYAAKLVWPVNLSFIYPLWKIDTSSVWQWGYTAGAAVLLAILWGMRGRTGRGPLAAVLIFGGTLTPALGFFDVFPFRYSFVADHFQYHASVALIALLCGACTVCWRRRVRSYAVTCVAVAVALVELTWLSHRQVQIYRDQETLWTDVVRKDPQSMIGLNNLGVVLLEQRRMEEAEAVLGRLLARPDLYDDWPQRAAPYHQNYAKALMGLGRLREAEGHFRQSVQLDGSYANGWLGLADVLTQMGRADDALRTYAELAGGPNAATDDRVRAAAYYNEGILHLEAGRPVKAESALRRAHELRGGQPAVMNWLGVSLARQGRLSEAEHWYRQAISLQAPPASRAAYLFNLASLLRHTGRSGEADQYLRQALASDPTNAAIRAAADSRWLSTPTQRATETPATSE